MNLLPSQVALWKDIFTAYSGTLRGVQVTPSVEVRMAPAHPTATAIDELAAMAVRLLVVVLVRWVKVRAGSVIVRV